MPKTKGKVHGTHQTGKNSGEWYGFDLQHQYGTQLVHINICRQNPHTHKIK